MTLHQPKGLKLFSLILPKFGFGFSFHFQRFSTADNSRKIILNLHWKQSNASMTWLNEASEGMMLLLRAIQQDRGKKNHDWFIQTPFRLLFFLPALESPFRIFFTIGLLCQYGKLSKWYMWSHRPKKFNWAQRWTLQRWRQDPPTRGQNRSSINK